MVLLTKYYSVIFLLFCKKDCGLWNRDKNSARNIYKIANNAISKKERPNYLSRSSQTSSVSRRKQPILKKDRQITIPFVREI